MLLRNAEVLGYTDHVSKVKNAPFCVEQMKGISQWRAVSEHSQEVHDARTELTVVCLEQIYHNTHQQGDLIYRNFMAIVLSGLSDSESICREGLKTCK